MATCPNCGSSDVYDGFCLACGTSVSDPTGPEPLESPEPFAPQTPPREAHDAAHSAAATTPLTPPAPAPSRSSSHAPMVALGVVAAIALAVFAFTRAGGSGQTTTAGIEAQEAAATQEPSASALSPEGFSREWSGTFGGADASGTIVDKAVYMTFSKVGEDGVVSGICTVGDEGSYNFEGVIDWSSGSINLYARDWARQGTLRMRRNYSGTITSSGDAIIGSCETTDGDFGSSWNMTAN